MTLMISQLGDRETTPNVGTFGAIFDAASMRHTGTFTQFCESMGITETTGRNWRDNGVSPKVNSLILIAPHMPADLLSDLLTRLACGRFLIVPVEPPAEDALNLGLTDQAANLRRLAWSEMQDVASFVQTIVTAVEDDRIDADEAQAIQLHTMRRVGCVDRIKTLALAMYACCRRSRRARA